MDEDDDEYRWIQVLVRGLNNASGNTTAHIHLFPAYAAYTISGADFVYTTNTSGQVVASNTPETTGNGVGVWGAVLERGVPTRRRPQLTGTAATLADNYFTSRITSLFYFKTPASDGIFATSGSDIYKYNATEDFSAADA